MTRNAAGVPATFTVHRDFDGLTDWKLFQRGPADDAPVPVSFGYVASADARVEVRVVDRATGTPLPGFDFADHAMATPELIGEQFPSLLQRLRRFIHS